MCHRRGRRDGGHEQSNDPLSTSLFIDSQSRILVSSALLPSRVIEQNIWFHQDFRQGLHGEGERVEQEAVISSI